MAKIKNTDNSKSLQGCREQCVGKGNSAASLENSLESISKLKVHWPCDPANPLLGV